MVCRSRLYAGIHHEPSYKFTLVLVSGLFVAALIYLNVKIAAAMASGPRLFTADNVIELPPAELVDPLLRRMLLPAALIIGLIAAPQAASNWELLPLFLNPVPFSLNDPLFDVDIGFYVFRLPMLLKIYNWLTFVLAFALLASVAVYLLYRGIIYGPRGLVFCARARKHLLVLAVLFLAVKTAGYYLEVFELVYSSRGAAFGASYTDVYANLPALRLLSFRDNRRLYHLRLSGEAKEEFVLLLPFTPNKRDNMQAWLAARSDPPHYGNLTALEFPKAKLVYGPKQIDARIDQDSLSLSSSPCGTNGARR